MSKLIRAEDVIAKLKKTYPTDRIALEHLTRIVEECEEVNPKFEAIVESVNEKKPIPTKTRRKTNANK